MSLLLLSHHAYDGMQQTTFGRPAGALIAVVIGGWLLSWRSCAWALDFVALRVDDLPWRWQLALARALALGTGST